LRPAYSPYLIVLAGFIASAAAQAPKPAALRLERSLNAMGTTYTLALYGSDRYGLDTVIDAAFDEVNRLDGMLSNYRADSEWSRVNREAGRQSVPVSPELFDLLSRCVEYSRQSEGAFDITVGPLMKIWGFYKSSGRVPHRAEIRGALSNLGSSYIQLDPHAHTVRFLRPNLEIDPGGIGKGYAVDRMVDVLRRGGVTSAFITAGRSSMYAIGNPPNEPRGWRVEIPDPRHPERTVFEVFLKNESMSTSGTTEKFFVAGGRTYAHIMDPRTGYPAQGMLQVSVITPRTLDSEAWTKPFFILGRTWTQAHRQNFRVFLCEDRTETACVSLP
jgi:FAD:protein FMN transferase